METLPRYWRISVAPKSAQELALVRLDCRVPGGFDQPLRALPESASRSSEVKRPKGDRGVSAASAIEHP